MVQSIIARSYISCILIGVVFLGVSCNKLIEVTEPPDQIIASQVFLDDNTVRSALAGIYTSNLASDSRTTAFNLYAAMCADELTPLTFNQYTTNAIPATDGTISAFWSGLFNAIYQCNAIIEGVESSPGLALQTKDLALGEAKFIRAFCNFHLVNYWGDVPLILSTRVDQSIFQGREGRGQLWEKIIADLRDAKSLLSETYMTSEKVRPNRWAAASLLARVYLYNANWAEAEQEATSVIVSGLYTPLQPLNSVFLKNSKEAIWQIWTVNGFTNFAQITIPGTSTPNYILTNELIGSFEASDQRKGNWTKAFSFRGVGYVHPFKYKQASATTGTGMEYVMVLRSAEQFLVRAEARAHLNKISDALVDINMIRARAGLSDITGPMTKDSCLSLIEKERRVELFTEYGHRWFDLKRTNRVDAVLSLQKANWKSSAALWPIPQAEIEKNRNLTQNPGY